MAAIRLKSIVLHKNKQENDINIVFMKNSELDVSVLQGPLIVNLWYPFNYFSRFVESTKVG